MQKGGYEMLLNVLLYVVVGSLTAMFVIGQIKADTGTATGWWSWFAYEDEDA